MLFVIFGTRCLADFTEFTSKYDEIDEQIWYKVKIWSTMLNYSKSNKFPDGERAEQKKVLEFGEFWHIRIKMAKKKHIGFLVKQSGSDCFTLD